MSRYFLWLSCLVNVAVIAVVAYLYFGGMQTLVARHYIQPSYQRWVSQFAQLPVQSGDTVFLGDSITEGGAWHEWFPNTPVRNRGISGDITIGVLSRLDQVLAGQPERIFLLIGTNDLKLGTPIADIVDNIVRIVDIVAAKSPQTQVYVQSVLPRAAEFQRDVERLNAGLQKAVDGKAVWVNLYPLLLDSRDGSIRDEFSNDELHLTGRGYRVWTQALAPYME